MGVSVDPDGVCVELYRVIDDEPPKRGVNPLVGDDGQRRIPFSAELSRRFPTHRRTVRVEAVSILVDRVTCRLIARSLLSQA